MKFNVVVQKNNNVGQPQPVFDPSFAPIGGGEQNSVSNRSNLSTTAILQTGIVYFAEYEHFARTRRSTTSSSDELSVWLS